MLVGMRKWKLNLFFFNGTVRVVMSDSQHSTGQAISASVLNHCDKFCDAEHHFFFFPKGRRELLS